ncbi:hypothetical protein [Pseudomonas putida]|uniref:CopG/DNA-binding domain-containing protein n=1 Tax=Pseudomonas putida TaxID=303 RepID=A0A1L7NPY9_PSEPU|nr:hypothetical protein [Pseudomonas putida]BAW27545.1 CopG/DNA-binding domain-containing protein [Pseudomonas putida]
MTVNTKLTAGPLGIFLPVDVLTKVQALAAADSRTVENFIAAAVVEKVTRADRLELMLDTLEQASANQVTITGTEERLESILALAAARGHTHGSPEVSQ